MIIMNDDKKNDPVNERIPAETNGDGHNLVPEETSWAQEAKEDLEDFIESQGIYIRQ